MLLLYELQTRDLLLLFILLIYSATGLPRQPAHVSTQTSISLYTIYKSFDFQVKILGEGYCCMQLSEGLPSYLVIDMLLRRAEQTPEKPSSHVVIICAL